MISGFRHRLSDREIHSGIVSWGPDEDDALRRLLPGALIFDLELDGTRLSNLTPEWERRELHVGESLQRARPGMELVLAPAPKDQAGTLIGSLVGGHAIRQIRKKLTPHEIKHRRLRWYAREDAQYRDLLPESGPITVVIGQTVLPNRVPDFERRHIFVGEAICQFSPGDILMLERREGAEGPQLEVTLEPRPATGAGGGGRTTALRCLVTKLISRPLAEFNEGEVRALILLLDENKTLWERVARLLDENERLKQQVATLEEVLGQFAANSFFSCRREFEDWVVANLERIEPGLRSWRRDLVVEWEDGRPQRLDLVALDRRGALVVVEILFNPPADDPPQLFRALTWLQRNQRALAAVDPAILAVEAPRVRGMLITNKEPARLVELCLLNGVKLCLVNSGYVVDVME